MRSSSLVIRSALATLLVTGAPLSLLYLLDVVYWGSIISGLPNATLIQLPYPVYHTVCLLGWVYFALIAAFFPLWLLDITGRAAATNRQLPFAPLRAASAFFVPVQQITLPFFILRSLEFRANACVRPSLALKAWWATWLLMFSGAVRILLVNSSLEQLWLYGGATLFCVSSLLLIVRVEHGFTRLS